MPNIHIPKPFKNGSTKNPGNPLLQKEKNPKQAVLTNLQQGAGVTYAQTSHGNIRFDDGNAVLPNDGRAQDIAGEIRERYGRHPHHFKLTEGREGLQVDTVHNYKFGQHPAMPWAVYCDVCSKRLRDGETHNHNGRTHGFLREAEKDHSKSVG